MRYPGVWLSVVALIAVLPAAFGEEEPSGLLQVLPEGKVDWGSARFFIPGEGQPKPDAKGIQRQLTARNAAHDNALAGLEKAIAALAPEGAAQDPAERRERLRSIFQSSPVFTRDDDEAGALGYHGLGWDAEAGRYRLLVAVPLFGARGIAAALSSLPLPPAPAQPPAEAERALPDGAFTGLIVDCGDLAIKPSLSPAILEEGTRKTVYGRASASAEVATRLGLARYYPSVDAARKVVARVGANPLVVRASGAAGTAAWISGEDARRVREADGASKLLSRCAVAFVIGR